MLNISSTISTLFGIVTIFFTCCAIGFFYYKSSQDAIKILQKMTDPLREDLERAGIQTPPENLAITIIIGSTIVAIMTILLLHLNFLLIILIFPFAGIIVFKITHIWVKSRIRKRVELFNGQLELIIRMLSSGVRSGLSMRQSMALVANELPDPAQYEFKLALVQTTAGVSTTDALKRLSRRMPSAEIEMMVRSIEVQSLTGGNIGKTLDHLAETIKDRRRLGRKIRSITAESRGSAWILGCLPITVGGVIIGTQPEMRDAFFATNIGHIGMLIAVVLESLAAFWLYRILQFKV